MFLHLTLGIRKMGSHQEVLLLAPLILDSRGFAVCLSQLLFLLLARRSVLPFDSRFSLPLPQTLREFVLHQHAQPPSETKKLTI